MLFKALTLGALAMAAGCTPAQAVQQARPVVAWGDSLTAGSGGTAWTTQFEAATGIQTFTFGYGGETSTQIKEHMLADSAHRNDFAVIWVGRNNYYQNDVVVADVAEMVGHLTTGDFIVLGVTNGDWGGYEIPGGEGYAFITGLNARLSSIYGARFIDVRADLVARYDPTSPQDVIDFHNDTVPTSLRADQGHLNTKGYGVVAESVQSRYAQLTAVPEPGRLAELTGGLGLFMLMLRRQAARALTAPVAAAGRRPGR